MALEAGFEPALSRSSAGRSTTELLQESARRRGHGGGIRTRDLPVKSQAFATELLHGGPTLARLTATGVVMFEKCSPCFATAKHSFATNSAERLPERVDTIVLR